MNSTYKKALEKLNDVNLTCMDFDYVVEISHQDGSHFFFHNAKMEEIIIDNIEFVFVWAEHCGYHAFFVEDLEHWRKYEHIPKEFPEDLLEKNE